MDIKVNIVLMVLLIGNVVIASESRPVAGLYDSLTNKFQTLKWKAGNDGARLGSVCVWDMTDATFQSELKQNLKRMCPDEYERAIRSSGNHDNPAVEALRKKLEPSILKTSAIANFIEYAKMRLGVDVIKINIGYEKFRIVKGDFQCGLCVTISVSDASMERDTEALIPDDEKMVIDAYRNLTNETMNCIAR